MTPEDTNANLNYEQSVGRSCKPVQLELSAEGLNQYEIAAYMAGDNIHLGLMEYFMNTVDPNKLNVFNSAIDADLHSGAVYDFRDSDQYEIHNVGGQTAWQVARLEIQSKAIDLYLNESNLDKDTREFITGVQTQIDNMCIALAGVEFDVNGRPRSENPELLELISLLTKELAEGEDDRFTAEELERLSIILAQVVTQ